MIEQGEYTGKILLAEPFMIDLNFKRAAVLVCDNTEEGGSVGFVLNKPLDMSIDQLVTGIENFPCEVYFGGPVQTDTIHYIHNLGTKIKGSTKIADGIYWGGDFEVLKLMIAEGMIELNNIRFFVGYTGWGEGQLEEEMKLGSWVVANLRASYVFKSKPEKLWEKILKSKGDVFTVIAQMPDEVTLN